MPRFNINTQISVDAAYAADAEQKLKRQLEKLGFKVSLPISPGSPALVWAPSGSAPKSSATDEVE